MRRIFIFVFSLCFLASSLLASNPSAMFQDQLDSISDSSLRTVLENSINAGLITEEHEFDAAVSRAESRANDGYAGYYSAYDRGRNLSEIRRLIVELSEPLTDLDKDSVPVTKSTDFSRAMLFVDIEEKMPVSYRKTIELCEKFNPVNGTNDHKKLDEDIDAYLESIKNDPTIKHALESTGTDMQDLKRNWFGSGRGFEHVIAGEIDKKKVSGYHWWYKFYHDERLGNAQVKTAIGDFSNQNIYTGSFNWDPDGDGPLPNAYKKIGGFINGNSAQVMLAVGHIAVETAKKFGSVPGAMSFNASVNGEEFRWQLYTMGGNIRTLYPIGNHKGDINPDGEDAIHYNIKKQSIRRVMPNGSTIH